METSSKLVLVNSAIATDLVLHKGRDLHQTRHYGSAWTDMNDVYAELYVVKKEEISDKKDKLSKGKLYYVQNHYQEWYIGLYNGDSFDFINDCGNFSTRLFTCHEVVDKVDIEKNQWIIELYNKNKSLPVIGLIRKLTCSQQQHCDGCSGIHCTGNIDGSQKQIIEIHKAKQFVVLETITTGERFFTFNTNNNTHSAKGELWYKEIAFTDDKEEAIRLSHFGTNKEYYTSQEVGIKCTQMLNDYIKHQLTSGKKVEYDNFDTDKWIKDNL